MEVGAVVGEEVVDGFFVDVGHVVLEVADEGVVAGVELELVDLVFLHFQELDFVFVPPLLDALQDVF